MLEAEEEGGEGVGMTCLNDQTRPNSLSVSFISELLEEEKKKEKHTNISALNWAAQDYTLTKTGKQLRDLELLICFILCTSE